MHSLDRDERIELASDHFFVAVKDHTSHQTGKIDKEAAWQKIDATLCMLRQLGMPWAEISEGYKFGLDTARDLVGFERDMAVREQFGG